MTSTKLAAITIFVMLILAMGTNAKGSVGTSRVLVPHGCSSATVSAAKEFIKYAHAVSGESFELSDSGFEAALDQNPGKLVVLSLISELPFGVRPAGRLPDADLDGFVIRSLEVRGIPTLVISSYKPAGVVFGVYEYFRRFCNVGYYYDGDAINKGRLPFKEIDVCENPAFKYRDFDVIVGHNGLPAFHSRYWQEKEWKHCVDWLLKNKVNIMSVVVGNPGIPTLGDCWEQAFPELNPENKPGAAGVWDYPGAYRRKMMQEVFRYGRSRGLRFLYRYEYSLIPNELLALHPDIKSNYLDADVPAQRQLLRQFFTAVTKNFGTDHLYTVQYGGEDPGLKGGMPKAIAKGAAFIRELDPEAEVLAANGWHFLTLAYTADDAKLFCDTLKQSDMALIMELCINQQIYKKHDYFHGADWWYGVLPSLAADSTFHVEPSFAYQIDNVKELLADTKHGKKIRGYSVFPENFGGVAVIYDFFASVGWNPNLMSIEDYVNSFATARYGKGTSHSGEFLRNWMAAAENVKMRHRDMSLPVDDWMINFHPTRFCLDGLPNMIEPNASLGYPIKTVGHLDKALSAALQDYESGKTNSHYERDIADAGIQYFTQLFYLPLIKFSKAYDTFCRGGDGNEAVPVMETQRDHMLKIVDCYVRVLSTDPRFSIADLYARFDRVKDINPAAYGDTKYKLGSPEFLGCRNYTYEVGDKVVRREVETILNHIIDLVKSGNRNPVTTVDQDLIRKLGPINTDFMNSEIKRNNVRGKSPVSELVSCLNTLKSSGITPQDYHQIVANPNLKRPMIFSVLPEEPDTVQPTSKSTSKVKVSGTVDGVELSVIFDSEIHNIPEYGLCRSFEWRLANHRADEIVFHRSYMYFVESDRTADLDGVTTEPVNDADSPLANAVVKQGETSTGTARTYSGALSKIKELSARVYLVKEKRWLTIGVTLPEPGVLQGSL